MTRDWETQFRAWAKPPGKTEQDRCDNAVSVIRNAVNASDKLRARGVSSSPKVPIPGGTGSVPSAGRGGTRPSKAKQTTVAVKIIDMLGEEVLITKDV